MNKIEKEYNKNKNFLMSLLGCYVKIEDENVIYYVHPLELLEYHLEENRITTDDTCYLKCNYFTIYKDDDTTGIQFVINGYFYTFDDDSDGSGYSFISDVEFDLIEERYINIIKENLK